jgi:hypothetical protein
MAANVAVAQDPAGNLEPAKDKSTEHIDRIVATIMAIGRAMVAPRGAAARVLHVLCLTDPARAARHIPSWIGVELGRAPAPPTPENIAAVMELYPVGERFFQEFTLRQVLDVEQGSGWSVDTTTGLVTFVTASALGVEVTADFEFDVQVRFDTDHMAVTIESYRLHNWQQIPIVELRI